MIDYSRRSSSPRELAVGLVVGLASLVAPPPASAQAPLHPDIIAKTEQYMERFRTLVSEQAALPPGEADRNAYNSFVQELRGQGIAATEVCAAILDESTQLLGQVERGDNDALRSLQCTLQCLYGGSPLRETVLAEERISVPLRELALAVLHSRSEHVTVETRGMALSLAFGNFLEQQIPTRLMAGFLSAVELGVSRDEWSRRGGDSEDPIEHRLDEGFCNTSEQRKNRVETARLLNQLPKMIGS